jgi:hypothetical protein
MVFFALFLLAALSLSAQDRGLSVRAQDGTTLTSFSGSHALVIGESRYTNGWPGLPGVSGDTAAIKRLLEEQGFTVETLENKTSRELRSGIEAFFDRYGYSRDVRLLIYYAGHGHTLKLDNTRDMGYIVPVDAPLPTRDETGFKRLAIAMQQFDTWAKQIESRHVLFVFDSCFSGSIFATSRAAPGIIDYKIASPVRLFISSGSADETVPDVSVFRRQMEAALRNREADYNKDGYVSGSELGDFLQSTVVNYSNNSQHPQYGKIRDPGLDKGDFIFSVGLPAATATATATAAPPPPDMETGFSFEVKSNAVHVAFAGNTLGEREQAAFLSGVSKAFEPYGIPLAAGPAAETDYTLVVTVYSENSNAGYGLLLGEFSLSLKNAGRTLKESGPYRVTETNMALLVRRGAERIQADRAFFQSAAEMMNR